jgi:ABC-type sugar transport system ATPase subunit
VTLLTARNVTKQYGAARALADVTFDVSGSEIHAIAGENGAGKSTLIKVLAGAVVPDAGEVFLAGERLPVGDPLAVRRRGISIVYQEFTLVPDLSVADNIFLGRELGRGWLRRTAMNQTAQRILDDLGVHVSAAAPVRTLSVAHQQLVEIARALAGEARLLVLDEPTASLSVTEADRLAGVLRRLRGQGLGIVYVSHRLDELFALADRITVLRDGRHVATAAAADLSRAQLIQWMVGRDMSEEFPARAPKVGDVVLELRAVRPRSRAGGVSLTVRSGEIVALAGLVGAGRTSAALAVAGGLNSDGEIFLKGARVRVTSPAAAIRRGIAYVTEDRKGRGILPLMSAEQNITLTHLRRFTRRGIVRRARERTAAASAAADVHVRAASLRQPAGTLSGGNQQKVLLARFLLEPPAVLILDEPTRGVDVGARAEIYALMNRLTLEGVGIVMISSDLTEVLGLADRIVVMRDGRTTGELTRSDATAERVMALATLAS